MKTLACTILMLLATSCLWGQGLKIEPDPALVAQVKQIILAQRAAGAKHDRASYASRLAEDAVFVDDDGSVTARAGILDSVGHTGGPPENYSDPADLIVWQVGDLIFASYHSIETQMYGSQPYRQGFRGTQIFRKTSSGLQVVFIQTTVMPNTQREATKIDPAIYDKYVGQYSAGPGDSETVTREGDKLFYTFMGARSEMKPIDANTFFIPGAGDDWIFVKNDKGEVIGLESRLWGQNILAKKVN